MGKHGGRTIVIALLAVVSCALTACGETADTANSKASSAPTSQVASPSAVPSASASISAIDVCSLVDRPQVLEVFSAGAPVPVGKNYGVGFAECKWESDSAKLRISVLPPEDLKADYINKLNVSGKVPALGAEAVSFPGLLGIGYASARGASVGFIVGTTGVLVAVQAGSDVKANLDRATALGQHVSAKIG